MPATYLAKTLNGRHALTSWLFERGERMNVVLHPAVADCDLCNSADVFYLIAQCRTTGATHVRYVAHNAGDAFGEAARLYHSAGRLLRIYIWHDGEPVYTSC